MVEDHDVVILGGGLAGLAAAAVLGRRTAVLERAARPGGLARTECFGGYWFDRVLHLLYFADGETEVFVKQLLGDTLARCRPCAWVETPAGTVRYPFQMHLNGLRPDAVVRCLRDLAEVTFGPRHGSPKNLEAMLLDTFGREMCELFLLPYNRKVWKRPLNMLAPDGQWTITAPDFCAVLAGALTPRPDFQPYNADGWYPRPALGATTRGMEVLVRALANQAADLRLQHEVTAIDLDDRTISAVHQGRTVQLRYAEACCATLPLPALIARCRQAPEALRSACARLPRNRVHSVALSVRGPRPEGRGHWRYYGDERLIFSRLVYLHEFDPACAPPEGWCLLVEVTEPGEVPAPRVESLLRRVRSDLNAAGAVPHGCEVVDQHVMTADPAYVVFTNDSQDTVDAATEFLRRHGVEPLGRYGRWEYSSMAQVMRDGLTWARSLLERKRSAIASSNILEAP